jgi:hypothetical protein
MRNFKNKANGNARAEKSYNYETRSYSHLTETLDWEITERPIFDVNNNPIEGYKQVIRDDNQGLLNICKGSYTPSKNAVLVESAHQLAENIGFTVAGFDTFEGGRKVLAFLENPNPDSVKGFGFQDFLMLGNSHDGSSSFWIGNTSVMVRCGNQFTVRNKQFKVNHTTNSGERIGQLLKAFELYSKQNTLIYEDFKQFASVEIDAFIIESAIRRILDMESEEISTRKINMYQEIEASVYKECFDCGSNLFGLFNGFTYYTTHVRKSKEKPFGNGFDSQATINETAYKLCQDIANKTLLLN